MSDHESAFEVLPALALHALDPATRSEVESHVIDCVRCQAELDGLLEVASALGTSLETPPPALWGKIAARLYESEDGRPEEVPLLAMTKVPGGARGAMRPRTRSRGRGAWSSVILAAAAAIMVLSFALASAQGRIGRLNSERQSTHALVLAALAAPGHRAVFLNAAGKKNLAEFVVLPDGTGYLVRSALAPLGATQTYQLWGIVNGSPVSLGLLGRQPHFASFTVVGSPQPTALALTVEPSGGSLVPAKSLVAVGRV